MVTWIYGCKSIFALQSHRFVSLTAVKVPSGGLVNIAMDFGKDIEATAGLLNWSTLVLGLGVGAFSNDPRPMLNSYRRPSSGFPWQSISADAQSGS